MRVREILEKAAYKVNMLRNGASIKGDDAVRLCGLLDDILAELSADNFFNCRATMLDFNGNGRERITIGEVQTDGTTPDVVSPRPYNLQSVSTSFGNGWVRLEEADLADISNYTLSASSGHPEMFAYEEGWPFGVLHFNRGCAARVRIVYSLPFPPVGINDELPIPNIYKRALVLSVAHAAAVDEGLDEDVARLAPEMMAAREAISENIDKNKPLRLTDNGFGGYVNFNIMGMR